MLKLAVKTRPVTTILLAGCSFLLAGSAGAQSTQAEAIVALVREGMAAYDLKAVIVRVTVDGEEIVTEALGESITGVPATTDMHFRNGAVAISYMSTLLLQLVDQGVVSLDDPLSNWLPDLPDAEQVTLRMLANMTAGYPDYAQNATSPRHSTPTPSASGPRKTSSPSACPRPGCSEPGTNWDYSHTNYVILGQALEQITGKPLATLMQENILVPLVLEQHRQFIDSSNPRARTSCVQFRATRHTRHRPLTALL